ncbi:MAG: hypothetical protein JJT99_03160 [Rhodobacteraceae bacterium]|nr:hypothetical protein [Paracoccaceae bacterium]
MCDRIMPVAAAISALLLPAGLWADTSPCQPLTAGFELCDDAWSSARRVALSDGLALESGTHWLEVFALPPELPADMSLDDLMDMIEAENSGDDGYEPTQFLGRAAFSTAELNAVTSTSKVDMGAGEMEYMVVALAEAAGRRIIVTLDTGGDSDAAGLQDQTRAVVEAIRPATGG